MNALVKGTLLGVAGLPVAAVATFLLLPLWRWVEAELGIESIGHSGPARWCYVAVYAVLLIVVALVWLTRAKGRT